MSYETQGVILMRSQTYEITFIGQAGVMLRAEFDDCAITIGPRTTTLRADLPDQGALFGLVQRITGLGLEVVHLHLVAPLQNNGCSPRSPRGVDSPQSG